MGTRGKNINLFLMDGRASGRIKATLANWTGLAFKIPRVDLEKCKERDEFQQSGGPNYFEQLLWTDRD